jgi:hypothetical protein
MSDTDDLYEFMLDTLDEYQSGSSTEEEQSLVPIESVPSQFLKQDVSWSIRHYITNGPGWRSFNYPRVHYAAHQGLLGTREEDLVLQGLGKQRSECLDAFYLYVHDKKISAVTLEHLIPWPLIKHFTVVQLGAKREHGWLREDESVYSTERHNGEFYTVDRTETSGEFVLVACEDFHYHQPTMIGVYIWG